MNTEDEQILPEDLTAAELEAADAPAHTSGKGLLLWFVKLAVAGFILWWLYRRGDIRPARMAQALEHWPMFLGALGITIFAGYVQGFRWLSLLASRDIDVPPGKAFVYLMEGKFFSLVVPGAGFGEDLTRGLYAIRMHKGSRSKVIASLLVDRITGVFTMLVFGASGLLLRPALLADPRLRALLAVCAGAIGIALTGLTFLRFVERPPGFALNLARRLHLHIAIDLMYAEAHHYATRIPLLLGALGNTLFIQALMILTFYMLGTTLGMGGVAALDFIVYAPCGMLATMLPVAPMGLGVGQVAFLSLFQLAHSDQGGNLYSIYFLMVLVMSLMGGVLYLLGNKGK
jgi:uncharacterized membrane protein YbhN (UPF0104 family)